MARHSNRDFQFPGRSAVYASNAMAACSHPAATMAAMEVLAAGGNAVDAGVAAAFVLNIAEPGMTGLGGDCFALYARPDGKLMGLNSSGHAPAALDPDTLRAQEGAHISIDSVNSITTPGAVAGLCALVEDLGKLELGRVLEPAIKAAQEGVPTAPRVAFDCAREQGRLKGDARRYYLNNGAPYAPAELFKAQGQAEILKLIAAQGARGFYEGPVAADLCNSLQNLGGVHTQEDFARVRPSYAAPISTQYRGHEVVELPPNGQGAGALLILDMLSHQDFSSLDPFGAQRTHLEAEAVKLGYDAAARYISDPSTIADGLERIRNPQLATKLWGLIDPNQACVDIAAAAQGAHHKDTVYLCVVDRDGGALSLIVSIFHTFGSGFASEKYGVLFHNRGAGFSLEPGHPNEARGGKRPFHTIIPGLLRKNGHALAPFGVMGGPYQAAGHARLISNLIDYKMDVQEAISAPRAFPFDGKLQLEESYGADTTASLKALGHKIQRPPTPIGGAQCIWIDRPRGVLIGGSDHRKDGCAIGV